VSIRGLTQEGLKDLVAWRCERVAEWTRAGVVAEDIAARLKISKRSVLRYRRRAGVAQPPPVPLTAEQLARAEHLLDDGCSVAETARTIGCSDRSVVRHFPGRAWTREQIYAHTIGIRVLHHALTKRLRQQRFSV
jgi:methylphosphotriester-DNA--protein-cysteine methyltransferase